MILLGQRWKLLPSVELTVGENYANHQTNLGAFFVRAITFLLHFYEGRKDTKLVFLELLVDPLAES
jgi:hypothetical protein